MSERDQESTGDYGYDLVHEDIGHRASAGDASAPRAGAPRPSGSPTGSTGETAGDLSYDEAHGF